MSTKLESSQPESSSVINQSVLHSQQEIFDPAQFSQFHYEDQSSRVDKSLSQIHREEERQSQIHREEDSYSELHYENPSQQGSKSKDVSWPYLLGQIKPKTIANNKPLMVLDELSISRVSSNQSNLHDITSLEQFSIIADQTNPEPYELNEKHLTQVLKYLRTHSNPQGQISYICQQLKNFKIQYTDHQSKNDNCEWVQTSKLHLPQFMIKGDSPKFIQSTQSSQTKKQARKFSCIDLLKRLYLTYPQIWIEYKDIRKVKKLHFQPQITKGKKQLQIINDVSNFKRKVNFQESLKLVDREKSVFQSVMEKGFLKTGIQKWTQPSMEQNYGQQMNPFKTWQGSENCLKVNKPVKMDEKLDKNFMSAEQNAFAERIKGMYKENPELFEKVLKTIREEKLIDDPMKRGFFKKLFMS